MHRQTQTPSATDSLAPLLRAARKPRYAIPGAIVGGMLLLAFFVQPQPAATGVATDDSTPEPVATATPTLEPTIAAPTATGPASPTAQLSPDATGQVAGVLTTATPQPATVEPTPAQVVATAQCGERLEGTHILGVMQTLNNISVEATRASVYPIEYLRCILLATGGSDAVTLAGALGDAHRAGSTHVALVDLWVTNGSLDFAQLTLNTATFSAAGQTFSAMGTLGGGAETVVASGQGRAVTLVGTIANSVGATTGPITVALDGPRLGGVQVPGKYQLFLPTP